MSVSTYPKDRITALVLAGGRARRMGGKDKGLIPLVGKPMIAHTLRALENQAARVIINANRHLDRYRAIGNCPVIMDPVIEGEKDEGSAEAIAFAGPLAGMASGLEASTTPLVLTVPCDAPLLDETLGPRLHAALEREKAEIAVAHDGKRLQPTFALLTRPLLPDLLAFLTQGGRKIDRWYATRHTLSVDFSDRPRGFANINNPEDLERLEAMLEHRAPSGVS
ncbi:molybdenum cofactor guanylyltransferase MobA [Thioalkalivibrio sp. HK1]|uniref:molybdenum cofactor guanylyltransferase MobA n=1 Tax=Thioalkalivibrio sp. HK1 TaxID=1469245 RepID=UPI0004710C64|nr:molybdenum cofactor guanylyltransferase MobA [Thioalkalivibrio sp. HK1]